MMMEPLIARELKWLVVGLVSFTVLITWASLIMFTATDPVKATATASTATATATAAASTATATASTAAVTAVPAVMTNTTTTAAAEASLDPEGHPESRGLVSLVSRGEWDSMQAPSEPVEAPPARKSSDRDAVPLPVTDRDCYFNVATLSIDDYLQARKSLAAYCERFLVPGRSAQIGLSKSGRAMVYVCNHSKKAQVCSERELEWAEANWITPRCGQLRSGWVHMHPWRKAYGLSRFGLKLCAAPDEKRGAKALRKSYWRGVPDDDKVDEWQRQREYDQEAEDEELGLEDGSEGSRRQGKVKEEKAEARRKKAKEKAAERERKKTEKAAKKERKKLEEEEAEERRRTKKQEAMEKKLQEMEEKMDEMEQKMMEAETEKKKGKKAEAEREQSRVAEGQQEEDAVEGLWAPGESPFDREEEDQVETTGRGRRRKRRLRARKKTQLVRKRENEEKKLEREREEAAAEEKKNRDLWNPVKNPYGDPEVGRRRREQRLGKQKEEAKAAAEEERTGEIGHRED